MSAKPTQDEIERVEAWKRERDERANREQAEMYVAARRQAAASLNALVGRSVRSAEGEPHSVYSEQQPEPYDEWDGLRLTFDDGSVLILEPQRYAEEPAIDLRLES